MAYFLLKKVQTLVLLMLIFRSIFLHADDAELPQIKAQALNIYTALKTLHSASSKDRQSLYIYVGNRADDFIIQAAKIQIDDNAPTRYVYSEIESSVLLEGGAHEITSINLAPGTHRVRAEIVALARGAGPNVDRIFPRIDKQVNVVDETHLELELVSEGLKNMLGNADIVLRDWRLNL